MFAAQLSPPAPVAGNITQVALLHRHRLFVSSARYGAPDGDLCAPQYTAALESGSEVVVLMLGTNDAMRRVRGHSCCHTLRFAPISLFPARPSFSSNIDRFSPSWPAALCF
jgi:hypothetical protein